MGLPKCKIKMVYCSNQNCFFDNRTPIVLNKDNSSVKEAARDTFCGKNCVVCGCFCI